MNKKYWNVIQPLGIGLIFQKKHSNYRTETFEMLDGFAWSDLIKEKKLNASFVKYVDGWL